MTEKRSFEAEIIRSIRQIIRAVDIFSKQLRDKYGLNSSQISCLNYLFYTQLPLSMTDLSNELYLSHSMLTSIVDQLEKKELVKRVRTQEDRRTIYIELTEAGREMANSAPTSLQKKLTDGLSKIPDREKESIIASLHTVVRLLEAGELKALPVLSGGSRIMDEPTTEIISDGTFIQE
jgi:MarR family transcriptional regulator, organic hydroperoxide resistance regulator